MSEQLKKAHQDISGLLARYDKHRQAYRTATYSELQARPDFVDKFLGFLGWDVTHETQTNPFEQEVKVERNTDLHRTQRRADYAFFLAPNFRDVRFFVEAKKPSVELASKDNYFQTIRYGWNSQTPLAFLINVEEVHVLDCRYKPDIDSSLESAVKKFHYTQLLKLESFAELYWLMSREATESGSLERFAEALPKRRGKAVQRGLFRGGFQAINDESFLEELDDYRSRLARSLKAQNQKLDGHALTEITQRILDRLVFLRFLEDKLIETNESVAKFRDKGSVWNDFLSASRRLDSVYNGIVFKQHSLIDTGRLHVDDKVFGDICEEISHVNSPYNFDAIPIHILGSIYERFLGQVIVATDKRAQVELKPEVRKAGGVYYTPEYIVRYIVERTIGRTIEGMNPSQIAKMRFADIACGSGSFLLGAYDYLLRYHKIWFNRHPEQAKKGECFKHEDGTLHLTLAKKREILVANIFGVDLDGQAVEVSQLSLYLKLLEEETTASAKEYQYEIREAMLPSLANNIVCGNSLFEPDVVERDLFGGDVDDRVNAMHFKSVFPDVIKKGGFDAVIGNPPYFSVDDTWGKKDPRLEMLKRAYPEVHTDKTDVLFYFLSKAAALSKNYVGFIVSRAFLEAYKAAKLRTHLLQAKPPQEIVDFRNYQVFRGIGIATCLITLADKKGTKKIDSFSLLPDELPSSNIRQLISDPSVFRHVQSAVSTLSDVPWVFVPKKIGAIQRKLDGIGEPAGKVLQIGQGMQTGLNEVFGNHSHEVIKAFGLQKGQYFRRATNSQVHAFRIEPEDSYVLYLEDFRKFSDLPRELARYLARHRRELAARAAYQRGDCDWWKFTWPLKKELYGGPKILCPYLSTTNRFALDEKNEYLGLTDTTVLFPGKHAEDFRFFLGLLNSQLLTFRFQSIGKLKGGGILEYFWNSVSKLPLVRIDMKNKREKASHDEVVDIVERLMHAQVMLGKALTDRDRNSQRRQIQHWTSELDERVYELYGIGNEEASLLSSNAGTRQEASAEA